ncbi:TIGR00282 family metallophosphoesterase [Balneola sp. MJW-20]|uniref:TIGR00282 family metallophosphoesterase n=1 Tax=Gracilimonas aurantiaca TaxID=3234185 RepID=UPI003466EE43
MADTISVFFVGDVVGDPGIDSVNTLLPPLIKKYESDFVIINGENSHEGHGINRHIIKNFHNLGAHVVTGGDHSFDKWKVFDYMRKDNRILRPLNYPKGNAGFGYGIYDIPGTDFKMGVLNIQGRTFMKAIDDPFSTAEWALERMREETNLIFVDFHAEATAEKMSMGWHIDGKASVMVGTHTHIPTNDARILPQGTGYITDAGMTGSFNSVIGMDKKVAIKRFMTGVHQKYQPAKGNNHLCGVFARLDTETGKCVHIESVIYPEFNQSES